MLNCQGYNDPILEMKIWHQIYLYFEVIMWSENNVDFLKTTLILQIWSMYNFWNFIILNFCIPDNTLENNVFNI